jgi:hypothetical protein
VVEELQPTAAQLEVMRKLVSGLWMTHLCVLCLFACVVQSCLHKSSAAVFGTLLHTRACGPTLNAPQAAFVKRSGSAFEAAVRRKEANNPAFAFLLPSHPLHPHYRRQLQLALGGVEADVDLLLAQSMSGVEVASVVPPGPADEAGVSGVEVASVVPPGPADDAVAH